MGTVVANRRASRSPLDDIVVLMPWGELGYQMYHASLASNPDYGYLINQGRVFVGLGGYTHSNPQRLLEGVMKGMVNVGTPLQREVPPHKRIVWLEHDHTFPLNVFQKHATYDKPYVSGLYCYRDVAEPVPVIYKWSDDRQSAIPYNAEELQKMGLFDSDLTSPLRGLHKVDVVPMGCLSVAREVYEQWPDDRPFFSSGTGPSGRLVGHDIFHCRVAQDAGWPIFVDTSMRVKHYGLVEIDDTFFALWYKNIRLPQVLKEAEERANGALDEVAAKGEKPRLKVVS